MNILKTNGRGLVVAALLAAAFTTTQAQSLTADDNVAIQQLSAGYT